MRRQYLIVMCWVIGPWGFASAIRAVQLVSVNDTTLEMSVCAEAKRELYRFQNTKLFLVSVGGDYRSGKSLLLNNVAGVEDMFQVADGILPVTRGIWIGFSEPGTHGDTQVAYLDIEGSGSVTRGVGVFDAKLSAISSMVSSALLANIRDVVSTRSLLDMFDQTSLRELIKHEWQIKTTPTTLTWVIQSLIITHDGLGEYEVLPSRESGDEGSQTSENNQTSEVYKTVSSSFQRLNSTWSFVLPPLRKKREYDNTIGILRELLAREATNHHKHKRVNGIPTTGKLVWDTVSTLVSVMNTQISGARSVRELVAAAAERSAESCLNESVVASEKIQHRGVDYESYRDQLRAVMFDGFHRCVKQGAALFGSEELPHRIVTHRNASWKEKLATHQDQAVFDCRELLTKWIVEDVSRRVRRVGGRRFHTPKECNDVVALRLTRASRLECASVSMCGTGRCREEIERELGQTRAFLDAECRLVSPVALGIFLASVLTMFILCAAYFTCVSRIVTKFGIITANIFLGATVASILFRDGSLLLVELLRLNNRSMFDIAQLMYLDVCPEWVDEWMWKSLVSSLVFALAASMAGVQQSVRQGTAKEKAAYSILTNGAKK